MSALVVTREKGETIHIDGPSIVTVLWCSKGQARIKVEADPSVRILRGELLSRPAPATEPDAR